MTPRKRKATPSTRELVREWRERDPEATAAEIARGIGISRQRVHQHLEALGLPTSTARSDALKGSAREEAARLAKLAAAARKLDTAARELQDARALLAELLDDSRRLGKQRKRRAR